ncbi:DUF2029 domain-containing protein [Corynebacterium aurimucosum]|uniref:Membrane protein n=3 Tax=Corynebacteriaceae TaxID=1653 RepID=A0ACC4UAN9_9CORY|nr:membrane protein [Corynebacterium minutissimum]OFO98472.1 hypothetical protein HMPREF3009_02210 [Corynebacterium sp. HMSC034H07]OHO56014.1 hypothetical protein HMPREF2635_03915 [Corynebacterium sp. HMSC035E02]TVU85259.1 DUF2029 domain-containing protein [Corynebacterium aurimucosum]
MLARLFLIYLLVNETGPLGDVRYYLAGVYGDNPRDMTEYPQVGTWPSVLLAWITGDDFEAYAIGFTAMVLLADGAFLALLLRHHRSNPGAYSAGWFWVFFGTAAGHVFAWRLDLYPALLVAGAGALLATRPRLASALLAWATAAKLWPGVLAAGLVGRANSRDTWQRLAAFFGSLVALCLGVAAMTSVDRVLSPLTYQGERGLQIESLAATWFVYQAHRHPNVWTMGYAASKSYEISGPGVDTALAISTIATGAALVWFVGVAFVHFLRGFWSPHSTVVFFIAAILLLIATNKVFSPQYIVWLGPILAVALRSPVPKSTGGQRQRAADIKGVRTIMAILAVGTAALGTVIYPYGYDYIWFYVGEDPNPVYALVLRNQLILVMAVLALYWHRLEYRAARAAHMSI